MISFALTEDQELARAAFQAAARDILRPAGRASDEDGAIAPGILAQVRDLGLAHVQGSATRDPVLNAVVLEELGWGDPAIALGIGATVAFVQAVEAFGSDSQKVSVLPSVLDGGAAAIAITEPRFDFDVTDLRTTARREGASYVVDGVKSFVPMAADCVAFLVIAGHDGTLAAFIVAHDAPGLSIEPVGTLGLRGLAFATVRLDSVRVDAAMRLDGCDVQQLIDAGRAGASAVLNGVSRAMYEYVRDYTCERFAHGSALARKQSVGFRLVDMHIAIESMRWMNWKAASELASGEGDPTRSARLAHLYACEQANWIADEGVQLLGGHGFLRDHPVELWFRATRTLSNLNGLASA